jgi:nucleotide-binding universal stress UspA family protein
MTHSVFSRRSRRHASSMSLVVFILFTVLRYRLIQQSFQPAREQYPEFEEGAKNVLKVLQEHLEASFNNLSFKTSVLFDSDPKHRMTEYLKEQKADLAVVATRGKHGIEGLFSSSFADHLTRYSNCDVYVLRPKA